MKYKTPIWENESDYPTSLRGIASSLLAVADREYQIRVWLQRKGPEVDWRHNAFLDFEWDYDWFKHLVRTGKVHLSREQVEAIVRVKVMWWNFYRMMQRDRRCPESHPRDEIYQINHPYWMLVIQQAEKALSLIRLVDPPIDQKGSSIEKI